MAEEQVKFPFEPNETVKAAFRDQVALERATKLIVEALMNIAINRLKNPWTVLGEEHPEFLSETSESLRYNHISQKLDIDLKTK